MMITILLGAFLASGGFVEMVMSFRMKEAVWKKMLIFLAGLLVLATGLIMMATPVISLSLLTITIAFLFVGMGITSSLIAFRQKPEEGRGWILFDGLVSILLGVFILAQWPISGAWALGVLVGVRLVVHGLMLMALGTAGKTMITHFQDARIDDLERYLRATINTLHETQVVLAEHSAALLLIDTELRKKVSTDEVDPTIQELNQHLKEARKHMKSASESAAQSLGETQEEAKKVFENLQNKASEITERLKRDLHME
jgi:uncharacterized membrane protein HdeD (DUF308 family)/uncharacterized protein YoxC